MRRIWILGLPVCFGLLASGLLAQQGPVPWTPDRQPWTTQDVIDERIDVHAQYSLMRLLQGDAFERFDASAMLSAVKSGELAGIYIVDQRTAALRAQEIGKSWWTILPSGVDAICITQPASKPPLIAFSKKAQKDQHLLDSALRGAWASCGLDSAPVRPYRTTLPPKQPRETRPCAAEGGAGPRVEVRVWDVAANDLVAGARVTAIGIDAGCNPFLETSSGADGEASFGLPCSGDYLIEAFLDEDGFSAMQLLRAEGVCDYSIVLWMRPDLEVSEGCDSLVYYDLLEECEKNAESALIGCHEQAKQSHPEDPVAQAQVATYCSEQFTRDRIDCADMARRGSGCE